MATSTQEWIDELKSISVLELSERIKALEEEFGVSAQAVAAPVAAGAPGGGAEDGGGAEEQTAFDVVLTGAGDKKIQVIKVVRAASGWPSVSFTSARMIVTCSAFGGSVYAGTIHPRSAAS